MARPFDPVALRRLNAPLRAGRGLTQPTSSVLSYEPGLDGLRVVAMVLVLVHHLSILGIGPSWFSGGFVGIEVFFVIAGYVITIRLLEEWERDGRIALGEFIGSRVRRRAPMVVVFVVAVGAGASIFRSRLLAELRGDVLATIVSLVNWSDIGDGVGHFARRDAQPLLQHLWPVAIEGQWYVIWPVVLYGLLRWARGEVRQFRLVIVALAVLSALLMPAVFREFDTFRTDLAYLATFTRMAGLLLGAVLATVWTPWRWHGAGRRRLVGLDVAGVLALVGIVVLAARLQPTSASPYELKLFVVAGPTVLPGGLFGASLLAVVAVAAVVHPGASLLHRAFGGRAIAEIGRRTFLFYVWHWPILVLIRAEDAPVRLLLGLLLSGLAAESSHRLLQGPLAGASVSSWLDSWGRAVGTQRRDLVVSTVLYALAVVCIVGAVTIRLVDARSVDLERDETVTEFDATSVLRSAGIPSNNPATAPSTTAPVLPRKVLVVGDSQARSLVVNRPSGIDGVFALTDASIEQCGVFDSGSLVTVRSGVRHSFEQCSDWVKRWSDAARDAKPAVTLVTLGAWDVFDIDDGETTLAFASEEFDRRFLAKLDLGVEVLKAAGSRVALLEVPCFRPVDVPEADAVAIPERGDDTRVAHLNALLGQAAADDPASVTLLAGAPQFCGDPAIAADRTYRWNGVDYYKAGAKLQYETIASALAHIPV